MFLAKLLYKNKYITPFINNLINQHSIDNAVFFSEYGDKNFLIILCLKNEIFEVQKINEKINFWKLHINENNFTQWSGYKEKIIKMKEQAVSSSSKSIILMMSENIRHISNQSSLSFQDTKEIFSFFLKGNQDFFLNNTISLIENTDHSWAD